MKKATRDFSGEPENVRAARRFVSEVAEKWKLGELAWPLVQIVSELASNAVIHAGTDFTVSLVRDGKTTRIEVVDHSARRAQSRGYDLDASTGRGLRLVETLSREWGVSKKGKSKAVWAVVDSTAFVDTEPEALPELFLSASLDGVAPQKRKPAKAPARRPKAAGAPAA
ncbi:MAG TPA: ATP-binding protein [Mycobacteriales bacterium]|nr:ATP-binding protein [Mycobacteriales bacterium]